MSTQLLGKVLVALQFGLLAVLAGLCLYQLPNHLPGVTSFAFWVAGIALGLWTISVNRPGNFNIRPEPKVQGHLVKTGPYRWIRHPMYASVLLLAAGASAWLMTLVAVVLWVDLLAVLVVKAYIEELWLVRRYPDYAQYQKSTWRLLPWVY